MRLHAAAVVIDNGQILLIQREDFKVWALPGGQIEAGESVAQAAIREVREETGIEVELTSLVASTTHSRRIAGCRWQRGLATGSTLALRGCDAARGVCAT
ncbi:MAG TPA: NUDIX domain-containing protein [Ktedonosporobacter sp.]|nr:NUDIX domain-containing protein [Ktedonosporobacter sp.]